MHDLILHLRPRHCVQRKVRSFATAIAFAILASSLPAIRALALGPEVMQSMVIVTGDEGRGSAFLVQMDGKTYLVTNSHVIRGNKNVKFKTLSNQDLITGPL